MRPLSMQFTARCTALEISRSWSCLGLVLPPPSATFSSLASSFYSIDLSFDDTSWAQSLEGGERKLEAAQPNDLYIYIYMSNLLKIEAR